MNNLLGTAANADAGNPTCGRQRRGLAGRGATSSVLRLPSVNVATLIHRDGDERSCDVAPAAAGSATFVPRASGRLSRFQRLTRSRRRGNRRARFVAVSY